MVQEKKLLISHSLVFLTGFALGKYVDSEELATYREAHESVMGRWRRRAGNAVLVAMSLGTVGFLVRISTRASSKS